MSLHFKIMSLRLTLVYHLFDCAAITDDIFFKKIATFFKKHLDKLCI